MMFFDYSVLCADVMSVPATPTDVDNITSIEIKNAWFDDLYVTKDVESDYIDNTEIPKEWGLKTILHAKFDGNLIAGNVDFTLKSVSGVLIKYKKSTDFNWIPLLYRPVSDFKDFNIKFSNRNCAITYEYEHAIVPVLNGIEGIYSVSEPTKCESNRLVIVDADEIWSTSLSDCFCDTTRMYPSTAIETLNNKHPYIVRNTIANYDTVTVSNSTWLPTDNEEGCELIDVNDHSNDGRITAWSKKFQDFLTNDKVKLLKNVDGRVWLGFVTTAPSDQADQVYNYRKVSFGLTETGEYEDKYDLYENGLINVEPEWL